MKDKIQDFSWWRSKPKKQTQQEKQIAFKEIRKIVTGLAKDQLKISSKLGDMMF